MEELQKLKQLLNLALSSSAEVRENAIKEFQNIVWNDKSIVDNDDINDIIEDIAYILDFYEPNEEWRKEDISYYGEDRLKIEIKAAIDRINTFF